MRMADENGKKQMGKEIGKKYCIVIGLIIALIALVLSHTYRTYIYAHEINDFRIAYTIGNLFAVPAALFFLCGVSKSKRNIDGGNSLKCNFIALVSDNFVAS